MPNQSRAPLTGGQLLLALMVIALATAVVPGVAAWRLNLYRVAQTQQRANVAAEDARHRALSPSAPATSASVVCGPGKLPKAAAGERRDEWVHYAVMAPQLFAAAMPTDAWSQCFLMNVGAPPGVRVWVLSAGPNGRIDTPFGADALGGDDIGAIVR